MANAASEPAHYLDSSALVKLVADESETAALSESLAKDPGIVTSEISLTEVPRAIWGRTTGPDRARAQALFASGESLFRSIALVPLTRELLLAAGRFDEPSLRSLDAIHIASALLITENLDYFVTYDRRQAAAAAKAGLTVANPGA